MTTGMLFSSHQITVNELRSQSAKCVNRRPMTNITGQLTTIVSRVFVTAETFPTVTAAITHKFKVHPDSSTKYFCPYCGQQFPLKVWYRWIALCLFLVVRLVQNAKCSFVLPRELFNSYSRLSDGPSKILKCPSMLRSHYFTVYNPDGSIYLLSEKFETASDRDKALQAVFTTKEQS